MESSRWISNIFASLVFSAIGFWMIREAKRQANFTIGIIGVVLMVYTYFTPEPWVDWAAGIGLCILARQFWE
jgi:hypothetical protein